MQQVDTPPKGGKISFLYGLSIGLILAALVAAITIIKTFVLTDANYNILNIILSVVVFLLGLAAYFIAGILASRQTAKVGTGCIAGLWTGVFYGIIIEALGLVLFFGVTLPKLLDTYMSSSTRSSLTLDNYRIGVTIVGVGGAIFGLLFAIGLGAGLGALGGLIGKRTSKFAPVPPQPYPYPAQPYQAQPYQAQPYPAQPYQAQPYQAQPYQAQPYQAQPYQAQPYPGQQVPQAGQTPGKAEGTDPNQSYSEHPY